MQMGDHLHEVSGVSVHDKGLDQVKALILGQPGTLLSLKYYSPTPEERAKIMASVLGERLRRFKSIPPAASSDRTILYCADVVSMVRNLPT